MPRPANRREFIQTALMGTGSMLLWPLPLVADETPCQLPHPLAPPNPRYEGQCPNCGMTRAMWARTWMTFENAEGAFEVCSFHCLADVARKSGETPQRVQVALYTRPETLNAVETASFVVGSRARGTMTMQSKIAFANREAAERCIRSCGGRLASFDETMALARQDLAQENKAIALKRREKKKIIEPTDNRERCPVCDMFPARYPYHKNQIHTRDQRVYHFCSTQCLFAFLESDAPYAGRRVEPFLIWVVAYDTKTWVSARTAYYVVGTRKLGPMGSEAFAFDRKDRAQDFARQHGGEVLPFKDVKIQRILQ
ncbi:MAG: nitrous oxide reductase accessory protein NosL [Desulfobacterales bacterium]